MLSKAYFSLLTIFCKIGYMFCPSQFYIFFLGRVANVCSVSARCSSTNPKSWARYHPFPFFIHYCLGWLGWYPCRIPNKQLASRFLLYVALLFFSDTRANPNQESESTWMAMKHKAVKDFQSGRLSWHNAGKPSSNFFSSFFLLLSACTDADDCFLLFASHRLPCRLWTWTSPGRRRDFFSFL